MSVSSEGKTCPKCQATNFSNDVFCFNCGTNLEDEKTLSFPGEPETPQAPPDRLDFPPGTRFAGRYQIIEEIGFGSMGRVFKARDLKLDQVVALKMIRPEDSASPVILNLFKKEAQLARSLSQENIIRVYDLGESGGVTFISMEYVPGQNLEQLLRTSGALTEETAVSITRQICRALSVAHRHGIVHRDLKPQNILIDSNGLVRVADFGLARTFDKPAGSASGRIVGTPAYMSPEQAGGLEADARSDMYSLGVIMYEMVTGRKPFVSETIAGYIDKHLHEKPTPPRTWNPRLSPRLETMILGCLEKDPAKRLTCAGRVLEDIEERRVHQAAETNRKRRRVTLWVSGAAAALGLAMFGIYYFLLRHPAPPPPPGSRAAVAVMYFENNTGDPNLEYLRKGLCYQIIQSLLQSTRLRVITTDRLFSVLKDRNLFENATYSTDDLKKVAERTQARYILQGSYAKIGRVYKVNSFLLDTGTWEPTASTQDDMEDLNQLNAVVERITPEIQAALHVSGRGFSPEPAGNLDKISTKSTDALKSYVEGDSLYQEGKFRESTDAYRRAIALDPEFARAYANLARVNLSLGLRAEAKVELEKALALAAAGRASLRDQLLFQGLYGASFETSVRGAVKHFRRLLDLYPDDEDGLEYLGSLYRDLEEWSLSQDCWERLLLVNKFNPFVYMNLSVIHMARGHYAEAADILPSDPDRLSESTRNFYLSLVYLCQGRYDEALAEIEKSLKREPGRPGSLVMRGNIRQLKGDVASAESDYLQVSRNSESDWQTVGTLRLANLSLQEGRFKNFRTMMAREIDRAQKASRKEDEYSFRSLEVAENASQGDDTAAEACARQALRLAEEMNDLNYRADALNLLGKIQASRGETSEAKKAGDRLKQLIDESGRNNLKKYYHHLMGMIALAEGDLASATDFCRMASEELPFQNNTDMDMHAYFDESRARVAEAAGDADKAISFYRVLIARTSGRLYCGDLFVRSYDRLGKLYLKKNLRAEAAEAFETFLRLWAEADPGLAEVTDARAELAALKPPVRRPSSKKVPAV
jgi:serine/threonine protein kinase